MQFSQFYYFEEYQQFPQLYNLNPKEYKQLICFNDLDLHFQHILKVVGVAL